MCSRNNIWGTPTRRGSRIPLHLRVTVNKSQVYVPPSLTASALSTQDHICCTTSAIQNRSVNVSLSKKKKRASPACHGLEPPPRKQKMPPLFHQPKSTHPASWRCRCFCSAVGVLQDAACVPCVHIQGSSLLPFSCYRTPVYVPGARSRTVPTVLIFLNTQPSPSPTLTTPSPTLTTPSTTLTNPLHTRTDCMTTKQEKGRRCGAGPKEAFFVHDSLTNGPQRTQTGLFTEDRMFFML